MCSAPPTQLLRESTLSFQLRGSKPLFLLSDSRKRRHSAMRRKSEIWPLVYSSDAARLDTVEDGVVPVSVEPCDFGVRVETQNVAVGDMYVLAFLCNPRHFGRYGPAHLGLDHHCVPLGRDQLDHFDSKVRNGIRKRAPNNIDATTDWHDALAAIRSISS